MSTAINFPRLVILLLTASLSGFAQNTGAYSGPWEIENSGSTAGLRGIHAVAGGIVWASGTGGTILRSEDSGYEWQSCATPPGAGKLDFRGIWAWDAMNALALASGPGEQSRLYRTSDGCNSWKLVLTNTDPSGFWDGILFVTPQYGLIYGDPTTSSTRTPEGHLLESHDGGTTWMKGDAPSPLPGELFFAASNSAMATFEGQIWLGSSRARVLRSRVGGSWQASPAPLASGNDSSGVFSVAFRDRQHGIAVGGDFRKPDEPAGSVAYSLDGGEHWSAATKPPHGYRSSIAWDATHRAWITAGSNGSDVSYDDGKTWQWLDSGNWNALSLPWAVGPKGQIGKLGTLPERPAAGASVSR